MTGTGPGTWLLNARSYLDFPLDDLEPDVHDSGGTAGDLFVRGQEGRIDEFLVDRNGVSEREVHDCRIGL